MNKELVKQYKERLSNHYRKKTIRIALDILENSAEAYPESYSEGVENFQPHLWVVAGVCEALESSEFWVGVNDGK